MLPSGHICGYNTPFSLGQAEAYYKHFIPLTKRVAENGKIYAKLSDLMK
jgi:hypothetical protein